MRRQHQFAILVALVAAAAVSGRSAIQTDGDEAGGAFSPPVKKSPRVFVNTSVPFSVAPQPVRDTLEVAHAKQTFMKTFQRIHDAVIAADTEHLNYTVLEDDLTNTLDDGASGIAAVEGRTSTFANRGPAPVIGRDFQPGVSSGPRFSIFPDPVFEPEYFLPSVHVDPLLMSQFNPPLPPNPFIQQIRPFTQPGMAGTCYEIILLEPENEIFQISRGNSSFRSESTKSLNINTHSSLLDAISPAVEGRTRSNQISSPASQIPIPVGTPALPNFGSRKPVSHFRAPQLSFLSLLQSGGPTGR
ncbi:uncharacterized protein LOC135198062 [Macrobrachium nipponense]|uniref:uncharacterized protein LOC135198062 n=1 Tax=Macrobrachium nipponense TaxID=159736 RepID=UPI0030C7E39F